MDLEVESQETYGRPERAPSERVEVWELLEYYSDTQNAGKSHPGVPRRKVGQINNTSDLAGTVRKLSTGPGAYYAAHLIGRDTIVNDVFEVKPKGQSLIVESSSPASAPDVHTRPSDAHPALSRSQTEGSSSAQAINATADTIRATKELLREVAPSQANPTPSVTRTEVAEIVRDAVAEAMANAATNSQSTPTQDPLALVERVIELQKKLQPDRAPRDELSAKDRAQLILVKESGLITEFMHNMRDMLRAPDAAAAEPGFLDKAFSLIQSALPYVGPIAGPAVGQKLAEMVTHVDAGALAQKVNSAAQPPQSPSATGSPLASTDPRAIAYTRLMRRVASDLVDNAAPEAAVAATIQLVTTHPDFAPQFEQVLSATPDAVAAFICSQVQDGVRTLPHCNEWIASYQSKLKAAAASATTDDEDEDSPLTFDDVLHFIKQQIIENQDSSAAVSSVIQLIAEQPDLAPSIQQLLATSNAELVKVLSQSTQTNLGIVGNAELFIEELKDGVTERLRVPVSVAENGHKPGPKVVAQAKAGT
jgi:hypothetical protein